MRGHNLIFNGHIGRYSFLELVFVLIIKIHSRTVIIVIFCRRYRFSTTVYLRSNAQGLFVTSGSLKMASISVQKGTDNLQLISSVVVVWFISGLTWLLGVYMWPYM